MRAFDELMRIRRPILADVGVGIEIVVQVAMVLDVFVVFDKCRVLVDVLLEPVMAAKKFSEAGHAIVVRVPRASVLIEAVLVTHERVGVLTKLIAHPRVAL